jgi:hypothetical protein
VLWGVVGIPLDFILYCIVPCLHTGRSSNQTPLKGTLTRDFPPLVFFHKSTPPRSLIHGLKHFEYGFKFAKKIGYEIADFHQSCVNDQLCLLSSRIRSHTVFEKALTCVSGTQGKLFDEKKKQRSKISGQGPFKWILLGFLPFAALYRCMHGISQQNR